ncbi:hypothetical protein RUM44_012400 [Polyplax serrata]|uniref:Uncharacterized protein n=1 Tax=Polyplax serrata TaxID=468196 RepID=A0ABR1BG44_POLSC
MSKRARATPLRDEKRLSGSGATGVSGTIGRRSIKPLALKKRDLKKLAKSYPALRKKSGGNLFLSSEKNSLEEIVSGVRQPSNVSDAGCPDLSNDEGTLEIQRRRKKSGVVTGNSVNFIHFPRDEDEFPQDLWEQDGGWILVG